MHARWCSCLANSAAKETMKPNRFWGRVNLAFSTNPTPVDFYIVPYHPWLAFDNPGIEVWLVYRSEQQLSWICCGQPLDIRKARIAQCPKIRSIFLLIHRSTSNVPGSSAGEGTA